MGMNVRCTPEAGGSANQNARRASVFIQNRYGGWSISRKRDLALTAAVPDSGSVRFVGAEMLIRRRRGWELRESEATPEAVFLDRRRLLKGVAAGSILASGLGAVIFAAHNGNRDVTPQMAALPAEDDPSAGLYPAKRNPRFTLDRPLTDAKFATTYNNFYEFGSQKSIAAEAQALKIRPWTIKIDGLVDKPMTVDIDDLLKKMPLEERLYRHRCVEAWSMAVPWSGFPMAAFVDFAKPLGSAKYVQLVTFLDPQTAPGQKEFWYPWPYVESLTIAEAGNELAFLVTGMYGKPVPKQDGAPLRLALPWKYGFKSVKSIVHFSFIETRPVSFWETVQGSEYGFWANVNPEVPHPRWSQATERVLGTNERVPTLKWNGYGEFVAHLYDGLQSERLFF
jgi:sulfoxide reductase catalytic subunit YedY